MAEQAGTEFWRGLEPIVDALEPDAQPEVFHQFAPVEDERHHVPLSGTVGSPPLWISPRDNVCADVQDHLALCREHYDRVGIGVGAIDALIR